MIKTRRFSGPSLTPMIDVVFLLLLFFLLSSQLKSQEAISMEIAGNETSANSSEIQLIEFGSQILLNGVEVSKTELIKGLASFDNETTSVAIRSEREVTYGMVVGITDQIRALGIEKIVLVEQQ